MCNELIGNLFKVFPAEQFDIIISGSLRNSECICTICEVPAKMPSPTFTKTWTSHIMVILTILRCRYFEAASRDNGTQFIYSSTANLLLNCRLLHGNNIGRTGSLLCVCLNIIYSQKIQLFKNYDQDLELFK